MEQNTFFSVLKDSVLKTFHKKKEMLEFIYNSKPEDKKDFYIVGRDCGTQG